MLALRGPSDARPKERIIRVNHALRGPGSRIRQQIWEGRHAQVLALQGPSDARPKERRIREVLALRGPGGWIRQTVREGRYAQVVDPFWVPGDAHPVEGKTQVVGGVVLAQVVGGVAIVGRGHDRDQRRNRTVKNLPQWLSPALTSALLAMVALALPEPRALAVVTLMFLRALMGLAVQTLVERRTGQP